MQSYDPRSPTQDFERTPIIISSKIDDSTSDKRKLLTEADCGSPSLRNDSSVVDDCSAEATERTDVVVPKNLCDGFYDMCLNDTFKESTEPLGSSTASNEAIEVDMSKGQQVSNEPDIKPTTLLETNFDYVECENDKFEDSEENIENNNDDDQSKNLINQIPLFKILDLDPRSPSVGIERTPIVVVKVEESNSEENVEEMSDDTLIRVLQNKNNELRQNVIKTQDRNSEGLLIYEDDTNNINDTPKKSKSIGHGGARTPLSCMKNKTDAGHARSKSVNTLYDPKNPPVISSKVPKRVSHIPRLKSLSKQVKTIPAGSSISLKSIAKTSALGDDCENTPPQSRRDRWDKDNSIVL